MSGGIYLYRKLSELTLCIYVEIKMLMDAEIMLGSLYDEGKSDDLKFWKSKRLVTDEPLW